MVEGAGPENKLRVIGRRRKAQLQPSVTHRARNAEDRRPEADHPAGAHPVSLQVEANQLAVAARHLVHIEVFIVLPLDPGRRSRPSLAQVAGLASVGRNDPHIAARRALVAHQPADKGDRLAIRRPARHRNLQPVQRTGHLRGRQNCLRLAVKRLGVQLCHPPVVLSRRIGSHVSQGLRIRRPIEFIHVQIGGRRLGGRCRRGCIGIGHRHALNLHVILADHAGPGLHGRQRSRGPRGPCYIEECDLLPVRRESRRLFVSFQLRQPLRRAAVETRKIEIVLIAGMRAIGKEGQRLRVRLPRDFTLLAMLVRLGCRRDALAFLQVLQRRNQNVSASSPALDPGQPSCHRAKSQLGRSNARAPAHEVLLQCACDQARMMERPHSAPAHCQS